MYRIEITHNNGSVQVLSDLFDEQTFEVWKFKDDWMLKFIEVNRELDNHNNFKLIRNSDDKVLLEKKITNHWYRKAVFCRRNMIYETVRKDMKFDYYKKDEHKLTYRIVKEDKYYKGVCLEIGVEGNIATTEAKAFTSAKKATHKEIFKYGLEKMISSLKKKKKKA